MQSYPPTEQQSSEMSNPLIHTASVVSSSQGANCNYSVTEESAQIVNEPTRFYSQFIDSMEMSADLRTVAAYFDVHPEWFCRCAQPMKVDPIGKNSYALVIGRFGSFGYEVEPKIGLDLLPQKEGVYRIETVPIPGQGMSGYSVDFRAAMELVEIPADEGHETAASNGASLPEKITRVQWQLDLTVDIQFPRFIQVLPKSLIQTTGDRLLHQIVRQVSGRLTRKVLEDFHKTHDLPIPKRSKRWFFRKSEPDLEARTGQETERPTP